MCQTFPEIPPIPPLLKGGKGGFLARIGLIQNAALDHVPLFRPFPITDPVSAGLLPGFHADGAGFGDGSFSFSNSKILSPASITSSGVIWSIQMG